MKTLYTSPEIKYVDLGAEDILTISHPDHDGGEEGTDAAEE